MIKIIKNNILMLSYVKKYCPSHIPLVFISSILGVFSNLIGVFYTKYIIDSLTSGTDFKIFFIFSLIIFTVNLCIAYIGIYINQYASQINTLKLSKGLQNEMFQKCIEIDYICYENPKFYNDFTMAMQQSDSRALSVLTTVSSFFASLLGITSFSVFISFYDPILFILVILDVCINFTFLIKNTKIQHNFYEDKILDSRKASYAQRVFYLCTYAKDIRLYSGLGNAVREQYNSAMNDVMKKTKKYCKTMSYRSAIQSLFSNVINILTTLYLALKVLLYGLKISDFVLLSNSTTQLASQITTFLQMFPSLYEHSLYIENFKTFINYQSKFKILNSDENTGFNNIYLNNVSYSYSNDNNFALKNITISIKKGDRIAFVGENGSGKSTLVKLLARLYSPTSGEILINNKDLNKYNANQICNEMTFLFQDFQIFALTIIENILMRKVDNKEYDEKIVKLALKKVGLYEKVMNFPNQLYTDITFEYNEDGVYFSGGELQRIAIARIYVKDSSFIVLDEPSSSLDPISENDIFEDLLDTTNNKTIILVTHRLTNISLCDQIYFFEEGVIVESGTHEELLNLKGKYERMYSMQQKNYFSN